MIDLGTTAQSDLAPATRDRISNVEVGAATPVQVLDDQANVIVVCSRESAGGGVPGHDEIEQRLRGEEMNMLSERYLRNLRREASIITRQ